MLGFFLAVAMILSYIESLIPFGFGIPGIKLGLPNLVVVLLLYQYGGKDAMLVNLTRIVLTGFLFSNLYTILYSFAGALFSFGVMFLVQKTNRFSVVGISILGGVFHNLGQLICAMLVVETFFAAFYLPYLLIAGTITGFVIGIVSSYLLPYFTKWEEKHVRLSQRND